MGHPLCGRFDYRTILIFVKDLEQNASLGSDSGTVTSEWAPARRAAFAPSRPGRSGLGRAQSESEMKLGPRPNGRPWTPAEDVQLLALLNSKMDRPLIARKLKRTVIAITTRLKVMRANGNYDRLTALLSF